VLSLEACLVTTKTPPIIRCMGARVSEREPPKSGNLNMQQFCRGWGRSQDHRQLSRVTWRVWSSCLHADKNWDCGRRHSWACWRWGETSGCHENALVFFLSTPKDVPVADPLLFHGIWGEGGSRPFGKRNETLNWLWYESPTHLLDRHSSDLIKWEGHCIPARLSGNYCVYMGLRTRCSHSNSLIAGPYPIQNTPLNSNFGGLILWCTEDLAKFGG
jgi:hypothetical protein